MPGLPAYAVPRSVNEPDRLIPFFTTRQALSTGLGVFLAVVVGAPGRPPCLPGSGEALYWTLLLLPRSSASGHPPGQLAGAGAGAVGGVAARPRLGAVLPAPRTVWKRGHR